MNREECWAKFEEHLKSAEDGNKFAEMRSLHVQLARLYLDLVHHL